MAYAHKNLLLFFGSAIITVSPWLFGFTPLVFVGLSIFLYSAHLLSRRYNASNFAFLLFSWFLLYNSIVFGSIMYSLIPLDAYGIPSLPVSIALVGFLWIVTVIAYSLPGLLLCGAYLFRKHTLITFALAVSFLWPFYEYIRASMMTLVWSGTQTHWGPHFSMASIGYFLHQSDIARFFAGFFGVFGIGLIIIIMATGIVWLFQNQNISKIKSVSIIGIIVAIFCFAALPVSDISHQNSLFFGLIQTNKEMTSGINPSLMTNEARTLIQLIKEASDQIPKDSKGVIILPEASDFFENTTALIQRQEVETFLLNTLPKNTLIAIEEDEEVDPSRIGVQRRALSRIISSKPAKPRTYQKTILTPGAEYLSTAMIGASRFLIGTTLTDDLSAKAFSANTLSAHTSTWEGIRLSPFTCSDSLSPLYTRIQSELGEIAFVHANLGYTRSNPFIDQYFISSIQMHAASNRMPFLVAPNNARAMAVDKNGDIIKTTEGLGNILLTGTIGLNGQRSWYNRIGDLPVIILGLTGFSLLFRFRKNNDIKT